MDPFPDDAAAPESTDPDPEPVDDWIEVECPYCGETIGIYLDPETRGQLVQDCEVCCSPWQLEVERDREGRLRVRAEALG